MYSVIGDTRIADVTDVDIDRVFAGVPTHLRAATRTQVYLVLHRLFDLAIMPGRLRKDNPVTRYHKPGKDADKLFAYLFPSEFTALLNCAEVPVERKVLYCIGCYVGLRKGVALRPPVVGRRLHEQRTRRPHHQDRRAAPLRDPRRLAVGAEALARGDGRHRQRACGGPRRAQGA